MADPIYRVPRPASAIDLNEVPSTLPSRGINRGHLTLYLTIAAMILSVGSVSVTLWIFYAGGQRHTVAEAVQAEVTSQVKAIEAKWADRLKEKEYALLKMEIALRDEQMKTLRSTQAVNASQQRLFDEQAGKAEREKVLTRAVLKDGTIQALGRASEFSAGPLPFFGAPSKSPTTVYVAGGSSALTPARPNVDGFLTSSPPPQTGTKLSPKPGADLNN